MMEIELPADTIPEELETEVRMLAGRLISVLNDSKLDDNRENSIPIGKTMALFDTLISVLASVECSGCRQKLCKAIKKMMPAALKEAMRQPASQMHVH